MARIKLTTPLLNEDETPTIEKAEGNADVAVTLRHALKRCLLGDVNGDGQPIKGNEKEARYDLYLKIREAGEFVELTPEEQTMLRAAALAFPTLVAGQVRALLSPKEPPPQAAPAPQE